jgi:hypothetical protein
MGIKWLVTGTALGLTLIILAGIVFILEDGFVKKLVLSVSVRLRIFFLFLT